MLNKPHYLIKYIAIAVGVFIGTMNPIASHAQVEGCEGVACVRSTTRLGSVNAQDGALLNAMTSGLLGSDDAANLSALEWDGLAQADIGLVDFLEVLQADVGVGSPDQVLNTDVDLLQIIDAAIDVAQTDGNTAAAGALQALYTDINALSPLPPIQLGDLLDITTNDGSVSNAGINILELIQGSISLFNYENVVSINAFTIQGLDLANLGLANLQLFAQVVEPPVIACGTAGTQFYSAGIRTKLNLDLLDIDISDELLGLIDVSGLASLQASVGQLELYASVARGQGVIDMIDALNNVITVSADPGVVDLYLGQIDDNVFFNRSAVFNPGTDVAPVTIGNIFLELVSGLLPDVEIDINARAVAEGNDAMANVLTFTGPYPEQQTAGNSSTLITNLLNTLFSNIEVSLDVTSPAVIGGLLGPVLNPILDAILNVIDGVLENVLTPVLNPVLGNVLDPLLGTLGTGIGEMDVTASAPERNCFIELAGCVYEDGNHNAAKESTEEGTGLTLYAKLVDRASPSRADTVVTVDPATCEYSFGLTGMGNYDILIDDNSSGTDVTSHKPPEWIGTENADQQINGIEITGEGAIADQNFGLFHGSQVSGMVFNDNGLNGGTAHNGVLDNDEEPLHEILLRVLAPGNVEVDRMRTDAEGEFVLWVDHTYDGQEIRLREEQGQQYISVSADPGTTGGTYERNQDQISFISSSGTEYDDIAFADVPANSFTPLGRQYVNAGTVIFYRHSYKARTPGEVTFDMQETSSPESEAWSYALHEDVNCNGKIDPAGDQEISSSKTMQLGDELCLVARVRVPAGIDINAQHVLHIEALYALSATSVSYPKKVHDETIVGDPSGAGLLLEKTVDKPSAVPGEELTYVIVYQNNSSDPLQMLSIDDSTPSYTVFSAAEPCDDFLPDALTDCTAQTPSGGSEGTITWEFEGTLAPGERGDVSYKVIIEN